MNFKNMLEVFDCEMQCEYKGRHYLARDNGSILRLPKPGCRLSKWDDTWTFGKKDERTGYMFFAGNIRVHQVVATAFHSAPDDSNMVIDHIDTNRCNNRPDNLRWITRLENVLNNPITRRKIEYLCGRIEMFLKDPSILRESASEPNTKWMRTVSKEEAAKCLKNLSRWAEDDKAYEHQIPKANGERLGAWIFNDTNSSSSGFGESWDKDWYKRGYRASPQNVVEVFDEEPYILRESLTQGAMQLNWKTPTDYLLCPGENQERTLQAYLDNLEKGKLFIRTEYGDGGVVLDYGYNSVEDAIVVLTYKEKEGEDAPIKPWALCKITLKDGYFIHENRHSFFEEVGGRKYFTIEMGQEWTDGDVFDDFC